MSCPLCGCSGPIRNSHIIPEFLHGSTYDEKHRVALVKAGHAMRLLQKGIREPLLCEDCEQLLNTRYEHPMSKAWPKLFPEEIEGAVHLLEGVDYCTFKLFHLSILWRASIAVGSEWSQASLGARHEQCLGKAILEGRAPDRSSYPVLGTLFLGPDTRQPAMGWIMPPVANRLGASRVYSTLYGGCAWHIVIASHTIVDSANPFVLSELGQVGLPAYDIMELREVNIASQIRFRWPGR